MATSDNNLETQDTNLAPWEKAFTSILSPLEEFIHKQSSSGILLMTFTIIALILANSPWHHAYASFFHTHIDIHIGHWLTFNYSLHHWINDGLMTLFFFLVGLEIKREILVGELASLEQALLPIIAAMGGMVVPALMYVALNYDGVGAKGWGIPMATDIAFAVGVLVLLGTRIPRSVVMFLLALAIVDDLGAVIVIAVFYTEQLNMQAVYLALGFLFMLFVFNRVGIRNSMPYFIIGLFLWAAMLKSGIHATLAGVLIALMIPTRSRINSQRFRQHVLDLLERSKDCNSEETDLLRNECKSNLVHNLEKGVVAVVPPLQRLEHNFHRPVAFIVIPLFALANAGVPIYADQLLNTLSNPITLGVIVGLLFGKVLGIAGTALLFVKMGIAQLPRGAKSAHIIGVGLLGGIGFTMSIFIAELGFQGEDEMLIMAKTGVLFASLFAGVLGYLWLLFSTKKIQL